METQSSKRFPPLAGNRNLMEYRKTEMQSRWNLHMETQSSKRFPPPPGNRKLRTITRQMNQSL